MAVRMADLLRANLDTLRYESTPKRIRAALAGEPVVDTCDALLVWEPRRIVPTYAVPVSELAGQLLPVVARINAGQPERRAGLIATQMLGLALCRYVLRLPPIVEMSHDEVVSWLGPTIQRYLER